LKIMINQMDYMARIFHRWIGGNSHDGR
jgi:hypothetical protein